MGELLQIKNSCRTWRNAREAARRLVGAGRKAPKKEPSARDGMNSLGLELDNPFTSRHVKRINQLGEWRHPAPRCEVPKGRVGHALGNGSSSGRLRLNQS